jgi:hypothetical protein
MIGRGQRGLQPYSVNCMYLISTEYSYCPRYMCVITSCTTSSTDYSTRYGVTARYLSWAVQQ